MDHPDREVSAQFSLPIRQIAEMLIVLALVGAGAYVALPRVYEVFFANLYLNGFILFVFLIGVLACFWQVAQLVFSANWVVGFVRKEPAHQSKRVPRLLAPLAALLSNRSATQQISSASSSSILESVATRIDEIRDITRYIVNLLIFLGLLGTFYGLATTVPGLVETIRALAPENGEGGIQVFTRLMSGLETQLDGMGTAFSSSLLGLAGSLVVGLLELFVSHGQNRFYRELEEWLSTITRVGITSGDGEGNLDHDVVAVVLDQMAAQMENMQEMVTRSDAARSQVNDRLDALVNSVYALTNKLEVDAGAASAMDRVVEGQERLLAVLSAQAESGGGAGGIDAESRMRLRSIDVQLLRVLEEVAAGRQETVTDLRTDLGVLNNSVRQLIRLSRMQQGEPNPQRGGQNKGSGKQRGPDGGQGGGGRNQG
ncbi:MAG: biopolymer transporter ExbB [Pseudoruegeria sp.]